MSTEQKKVDFVSGMFVKQHIWQNGGFCFNVSIKEADIDAIKSKAKNGFVNIQIKQSTSGNWFAAYNNFTPNQNASQSGTSQQSSVVNESQARAAAVAQVAKEEDDLPF